MSPRDDAQFQVRLNCKISPATDERLHRFARDHHRSIGSVVREALDKLLPPTTPSEG